MSILPAPGACPHENSKPIETREGGSSETDSHQLLRLCNLSIDKLEIPSFDLLCKTKSHKGPGVRVWAGGSDRYWRGFCRPQNGTDAAPSRAQQRERGGS